MHYDSDRWRALRERARQPGMRGKVRDASVSIPDQITAEQLRDQYARRAPGQRASFRGSDGEWREGWTRERHAEALKAFRDALRQRYRDEEEAAYWREWVREHMSPWDWGKPRSDPHRMNTPSVLSYLWPAARPQPLGLKTSAGQGNSSETMTAGFGCRGL